MFKQLTVACAIVTVALASGCATVEMASSERDASAKTFALKPDMANIYVYRNETLGAAIRMPVILNGKLVGDTAANTYFLLEVPPGTHTVMSRGESDSSVKIDAVAGRNYFIWQEMKMGFAAPRVLLQIVDEATGKAGVGECKLVEVAK